MGCVMNEDMLNKILIISGTYDEKAKAKAILSKCNLLKVSLCDFNSLCDHIPSIIRYVCIATGCNVDGIKHRIYVEGYFNILEPLEKMAEIIDNDFKLLNKRYKI